MFGKFLSIFISKAPDRLVYLILIISVLSLGTFAYDHVGMPIQMASASSDASLTSKGAVDAAVNWVYEQKCFGDRIKLDSMNATAGQPSNGGYDVLVKFDSLEYMTDINTGALHHLPVSHSIDVRVVDGKVAYAAEGFQNLMQEQENGPLSNLVREYV